MTEGKKINLVEKIEVSLQFDKRVLITSTGSYTHFLSVSGSCDTYIQQK